MTIRTLLLVPSDRISVPYDSTLRYRVQQMKYAITGEAGTYDGELQFYGDIPKILGKDNTFVYRRYRPHLHSSRLPEGCPYPSCHNSPHGTSIKKDTVAAVIKKVDAILLSPWAGDRVQEVITLSRKHNKPIAMIDHRDHETLYGVVDKRKEMLHGYEQGRDYDIYFKRELFMDHQTDRILPLSPLPIRPESYHFPEVAKDKSIFYSGRPRPKLCQADRMDAVELVKKHIPNALIFEHESRKDFLTAREYLMSLARSKMALSPSGKSWDSFRHTEVAYAPDTMIIMPKPYIEITGRAPQDGVHGIIYDTDLRDDGKYHLSKPKELLERLTYYLEHDEERIKCANAWKQLVSEDHTIHARSKYILKSMENVF